MFRILVVTVTASLGLGLSAASADEYTAKLARLLDARRDRLATDVPFHAPLGRPPTVLLAIPAGIHPARTYDFGGWYDPLLKTFLFNPKYVAALNRLGSETPAAIDSFFTREDEFRATLDHELGHELWYALATQREGTVVADEPRTGDHPGAQRLAASMLAEGFAAYVQHRADTDRTPQGYLLLPSSWVDPNWRHGPALLREGGYWIVYPILEQFGERGLDYLLAHPLRFPDGDVATAGLTYRTQALHDLGKP